MRASLTRKIVFVIGFAVAGFMAAAQKVDIDWIELAGEKIIVHYTLEDANPVHEYQVSLFSSKDNFAAPLTKVAGDVGAEIKPGADRKIEWSIVQELAGYKGDMSLEVRAKVFLPFVKIAGFDTKKTYKRGKTHPLTWNSGNRSGTIDIELFDGKDRVQRDPNVANTGKYEWVILPSIKPGSNYRLRFTDTKNRDEFVETGTFKIAPKVSTVIKIGGALLVIGGGVAAATLLNNDGKPPEDSSLPDQPGMPTNN